MKFRMIFFNYLLRINNYIIFHLLNLKILRLYPEVPFVPSIIAESNYLNYKHLPSSIILYAATAIFQNNKSGHLQNLCCHS